VRTAAAGGLRRGASQDWEDEETLGAADDDEEEDEESRQMMEHEAAGGGSPGRCRGTSSWPCTTRSGIQPNQSPRACREHLACHHHLLLACAPGKGP